MLARSDLNLIHFRTSHANADNGDRRGRHDGGRDLVDLVTIPRT